MRACRRWASSSTAFGSDRKSTRLNSSHSQISYAVFCLKKKKIRVLAGAEVDILKDGSLDYSDEVLAQLDVVVCSIHSYFNVDRAAMTERMLAAIENPYTQIIAHPTGRLLLRRDPFDYDMEKVLEACLKHGVAMECNSYPDRLDLKDVYLRMCKERGVKEIGRASCRERV